MEKKERIKPLIVKIIPGNKTHHFFKKMPVFKLLEELGLNSESVVVIRNGTPLTKDLIVAPGEQIEIISVISGGKKP